MHDPTSRLEAPTNLWHNRAFMRLWLAQMISNTGTAISNIALPLTAVLLLHAAPLQMGLIGVANSVPNLLFALIAGVWVDRARRRPILVGADLGRALLLSSIPIAALLHRLTFVHLLVVTFLAGTLSIFFTIASVAALPSIVRRDQLVEANSRLWVSDAILSIAGPSIAGLLVQMVSAAEAIIADALSYVFSAFSLRSVRISEDTSGTPERGDAWKEIVEGARELMSTPILRSLTISASAGTFAVAVQTTVLILFLTQDLRFTPGIIGLVFACNGVGSLMGAIAAGPLARRGGIGSAMIIGSALWAIGGVSMPLAGSVRESLLCITIGQFIAGIGTTIYTVNQVSLRQSLTPVRLLGRVTATRRFVLFGTASLGSVAGGLLGRNIGLRRTLLVGAVALGLEWALVSCSPVRHVHKLPDSPSSY